VHSEHAADEDLAKVNARHASLGEVLGASRVISLHKGATEHSRNLLGREELALLQRGSVLINTARASIIDTTALLERARKGDIVVALDVFDTEPLPAGHPLRKLSNVILTPHNASSTPQCASRVGSQAMKILTEWLDGAPVTGLSRDQLEAMT
jgi:phosphoglycerate dehydrogenase-like enzyme